MIACSIGEEKKLMSHVICTYLVDLEELFIYGFICIDIFGVYAIQADVL